MDLKAKRREKRNCHICTLCVNEIHIESLLCKYLLLFVKNVRTVQLLKATRDWEKYWIFHNMPAMISFINIKNICIDWLIDLSDKMHILHYIKCIYAIKVTFIKKKKLSQFFYFNYNYTITNIFIKMYTRLNSNQFFLAFEGTKIKCIYLFISHTNWKYIYTFKCCII